MSGLPGLAAFEKRIREQGKPFVLLAFERQNSSDSEITALCKEKGAEFTVMSGGEYPGRKGSGLPGAVVFDHTGKEIFQGYPTQAEVEVEKALERAPSLYLGERIFTKLKSQAAQIQKKTSLGSVAATLRKKLESEDAVEKEEAQALLDVLDRYAKARTAGAEAYQASDPPKALEELKALAKEFSGDTLGTDAAAQASTLAADPAFKKLAEGFKKLEAHEKKLEALPPCKACKSNSVKAASLACDDCKKTNAAALAGIRKALEDLASKHAGTAVEEKARGLASTF